MVLVLVVVQPRNGRETTISNTTVSVLLRLLVALLALSLLCSLIPPPCCCLQDIRMYITSCVRYHVLTPITFHNYNFVFWMNRDFHCTLWRTLRFGYVTLAFHKHNAYT